jgi:signal transduction histidine kinase
MRAPPEDKAEREREAAEWRQQRFVARARALFYARMMFLTFGLLILGVPAWAHHFGLRGPWPVAGYLGMLLYSVANDRLIQRPKVGRLLTYLTLCLDLAVVIFLLARPQVGGLSSPFLATQLLFTTLFAILFPKPVALIPPLLVLLITEKLDLLFNRSVAAVELLTVFWYLALNIIIVYVLVYLNEREEAAHREVVRLQSEVQHLAVAEERNRLARDIHDGLGASLSSVILQAEYLLQLPQDSSLRDEISELKASAEESMEELRRSLRMMKDDFQLSSGLEDYLRSFRERAQLEVEFEKVGKEAPPPPEAQLALFRMLQEALSNVAKHAQARKVRVRLAFGARAVELAVSDDGKGFEPSEPRADHYGLDNIRERAMKFGGEVSIESAQGRGTRLLITLPTSPSEGAPS